jgi:hypothetical protein
MAQRAVGGSAVSINRVPDSCPLCHSAIQPTDAGASSLENSFAEIVFKCPSQKCSRLFIARYSISRDHGGSFLGGLIEAVPSTPVFTAHTNIINNLSQSYIRIFGQAETAEAYGLDEIAGVGYRRSLEFLIKDYLLSIHKESSIQEDIRKQMLGKCIDKYIKNENIKLVAKRATWLGNDETHYVRKWEGKDIKDLKKLITMTIAWIEIEQLTIELEKDMPEATT